MTHKKHIGAKLTSRGASFRVWAPFANEVAVVGSFNDWQPTQMASEPHGYWHVDIPHAVAGQEYKFQIKSGDNTYTRNDPRALHFTTSSGNSVLVDTQFEWLDDGFTMPPPEQQVLYELHVGTFFRPDPAVSGTFNDVGAKLDHLARLGVNVIELMPIAAMSMDRGWGYAPDYIYAIESLYGGRRQFIEFVQAAHQRGIGVIVDIVFNHFGPDSHLDLWQFDGWSENNLGGIYFYNDWRAKTPWGNTRPDFGRPEVSQYLLDNITMLLQDCHVDGLRVDSTIFMRNVEGYNNNPDNDLPEAWRFLQDLNSVARSLRPHALLIAEDVADNEFITRPSSDGGAGFGSQWELTFPRALREALNKDGVNLSGVAGLLSRKFNNSALQRVIFSDSHDSAANGQHRINEDISPNRASSLLARKKMLIANAIVLTTPGIPMLLQGQEFVEDGAFNDWKSLDWNKAEQFSGVVDAHAHLIALRKNQNEHTRGLTGESVNLSHFDETNNVIAYHRWAEGGAKDDVIVIINFAQKAHQIYDIGFPRDGEWIVRFNSSWNGYNPDSTPVEVPNIHAKNGSGSLVLPPYCALALSQDS